jgi:hypothetical protein
VGWNSEHGKLEKTISRFGSDELVGAVRQNAATIDVPQNDGRCIIERARIALIVCCRHLQNHTLM